MEWQNWLRFDGYAGGSSLWKGAVAPYLVSGGYRVPYMVVKGRQIPKKTVVAPDASF